MAAVQSAPVFALPHHPHHHHHQGVLPVPAHPPAPPAQQPQLLPHNDDDDDDDDDDDEGAPWWLQGHAGIAAPPLAPAPAPAPQQGQHHQQQQQHGGGGGRGGDGFGGMHNDRGDGDGHAGMRPLGFLLRQLFVLPILALARLGSKHHGHRHHHHHGHGPAPPPQQQQPPPFLTTAEAEEEDAPEEEEGEPRLVLLVGVPRVYSCGSCRAHVASDLDVVSRAFQGRGGRAFLLDQAVNVVTGPPEDRLLMTGLHNVADLCCAGCKALLGWKYEKAHEPSQRYKEGKFILERVRLYHEAEDGEGGKHNEGWLSL